MINWNLSVRKWIVDSKSVRQYTHEHTDAQTAEIHDRQPVGWVAQA